MSERGLGHEELEGCAWKGRRMTDGKRWKWRVVGMTKEMSGMNDRRGKCGERVCKMGEGCVRG